MVREFVLQRAHSYYVDWLFGSGNNDGFGYSRDWIRHSPRLLFWYAIAGVPRGGEDLAWRWLALVDRGQHSRLPRPRRRNWHDAAELASQIHQWTGSALVPWLGTLGRHSILGWLRLQDVHLVGPKVASWIMRDVSFMVDYAGQVGSTAITYRNRRDRRWFEQLSRRVQACFVPIDDWVYKNALAEGALPPSWRRLGLPRIQGSPERHLEAATEIVAFAQKRGCDPRDLDCFWYLRGSEEVDDAGRKIAA